MLAARRPPSGSSPHKEADCRGSPRRPLPPPHVGRALLHPSPHVRRRAHRAPIKAPEASSQVPRVGARAWSVEGRRAPPGSGEPEAQPRCPLGTRHPSCTEGLLRKALPHHPRPRHLCRAMPWGALPPPRSRPRLPAWNRTAPGRPRPVPRDPAAPPRALHTPRAARSLRRPARPGAERAGPERRQ